MECDALDGLASGERAWLPLDRLPWSLPLDRLLPLEWDDEEDDDEPL
ncbi:MAG: hypothetical protein H0T79_20210, partial [Deltaproteobacteria bacterium]|nr:hypothetical protein [Deltaproteobacteria bacterium]